MANFKFKKNPKNINLDSVITDEMPICCGGGEAYCEGKITGTYDDGKQEVFYKATKSIVNAFFRTSGDWLNRMEEKEIKE